MIVRAKGFRDCRDCFGGIRACAMQNRNRKRLLVLSRLGLLEEDLVLLLGLDESLLEEVGVCSQTLITANKSNTRKDDLLSEFANRMARVWASGSPSLTSAAAFQTQLLSDPTLGESFISGTTIPC